MSIAQATIVDRFVPRTIVNNISLVLGGALITALAAQVQIQMWPDRIILREKVHKWNKSGKRLNL